MAQVEQEFLTRFVDWLRGNLKWLFLAGVCGAVIGGVIASTKPATYSATAVYDMGRVGFNYDPFTLKVTRRLIEDPTGLVLRLKDGDLNRSLAEGKLTQATAEEESKIVSLKVEALTVAQAKTRMDALLKDLLSTHRLEFKKRSQSFQTRLAMLNRQIESIEADLKRGAKGVEAAILKQSKYEAERDRFEVETLLGDRLIFREPAILSKSYITEKTQGPRTVPMILLSAVLGISLGTGILFLVDGRKI